MFNVSGTWKCQKKEKIDKDCFEKYVDFSIKTFHRIKTNVQSFNFGWMKPDVTFSNVTFCVSHVISHRLLIVTQIKCDALSQYKQQYKSIAENPNFVTIPLFIPHCLLNKKFILASVLVIVRVFHEKCNKHFFYFV